MHVREPDDDDSAESQKRKESALAVRRGEDERDNAPAEELPVLLELAAEPRPVAVGLRLARDDDLGERRRVVGKDVARVEQALVEQLRAEGG